jgi:hypothetical protein
MNSDSVEHKPRRFSVARNDADAGKIGVFWSDLPFSRPENDRGGATMAVLHGENKT